MIHARTQNFPAAANVIDPVFHPVAKDAFTVRLPGLRYPSAAAAFYDHALIRSNSCKQPGQRKNFFYHPAYFIAIYCNIL